MIRPWIHDVHKSDSLDTAQSLAFTRPCCTALFGNELFINARRRAVRTKQRSLTESRNFSQIDADLTMSVPSSLHSIPAFAQASSTSASKLEQMEGGGREILGTG